MFRITPPVHRGVYLCIRFTFVPTVVITALFFFFFFFKSKGGEKKENLTMLPAVSSSDFNKSFASLIFKCDPLLLFIASVSKRNAFPGRGSDNIRRLKTSGIWDWLLFPLFDFPFLECKISCWRGLFYLCCCFFCSSHLQSASHGTTTTSGLIKLNTEISFRLNVTVGKL